MSLIKTQKLKLIKESDDELIDPFPLNWPILDKYAGGLLVADGITPTDADLYDGCLVSEQTSGKQWIARFNATTLTYDKAWLVYPWYAEVGTPSIVVQSSAFNNTAFGFTNYWSGINSSAADISDTFLHVPITAVYKLVYSVRGGQPNGNDAPLSAHISVNSDANYVWSETLEKMNGNYTVNCSQLLRKLNAGDKLCMNIWQAYGAPMAVSIVLQASVVCPL